MNAYPLTIYSSQNKLRSQYNMPYLLTFIRSRNSADQQLSVNQKSINFECNVNLNLSDFINGM